jgi:hypothetical protein
VLQAGKSQVRFLMRPFSYSIDPILPAPLMALGSTQRLTKMSTRNLSKGKERQAPKSDKIREPRRITTLRASAACYMDSFTLSFMLPQISSPEGYLVAQFLPETITAWFHS